jgi:hypothetical protein
MSHYRCPIIAFRPVTSVIFKGKPETLDFWELLHNGAHGADFVKAYAYTYDQLKVHFADLLAARANDPCILLHVDRLRRGAEMVTTDK